MVNGLTRRWAFGDGNAYHRFHPIISGQALVLASDSMLAEIITPLGDRHRRSSLSGKSIGTEDSKIRSSKSELRLSTLSIQDDENYSSSDDHEGKAEGDGAPECKLEDCEWENGKLVKQLVITNIQT